LVTLRHRSGNWLRQLPEFHRARFVRAFAHHAAHVQAAPWQAWHSPHPRCLAVLSAPVVAISKVQVSAGSVFKLRVIGKLGLGKVCKVHLVCHWLVLIGRAWYRVQS
jgi:hypothetical protein